MKKVCELLVIILFLSGPAAVAQSEKEMAEEYFKSNDCTKALSYYTILLKSSFEKNSLKNYSNCIIKTKAWNEGEQFFQKASKKRRP